MATLRDRASGESVSHSGHHDGGIQDNTVNRLLLMPSSEHHLPSVQMAFFIEPAKASVGGGSAVLAKPARS
ncbi:conserved hypothetical protein (plasmid) [Novosphingobium sp. PP1Y]|nr:conserved hypothetical protein [Novosphingobium sp. PP1Y]